MELQFLIFFLMEINFLMMVSVELPALGQSLCLFVALSFTDLAVFFSSFHFLSYSSIIVLMNFY